MTRQGVPYSAAMTWGSVDMPCPACGEVVHLWNYDAEINFNRVENTIAAVLRCSTIHSCARDGGEPS